MLVTGMMVMRIVGSAEKICHGRCTGMMMMRNVGSCEKI